MSFFSNQNLQINGDVMTNFDVIKRSEAIAVQNSKGFQDFSTLASWVDLDPMKNMMKLETAWNKQSIQRVGLFQDAIKNDAVLEVNGEEGEFYYQMAVETDNCMKTVEDTSDQAVEGGVGADGTPFRIVLNKVLAPFAQISCDGIDGDTIIISEIYPVEDLGYGFTHWATLTKSLTDSDATYDPSLLEANREYSEISSSGLAEYSEELSPVHMPSGTNYITNKFKLGSGQGVETFVTGKAQSVNLMPGYTSTDTQEYLNEVKNQGYDDQDDVLIGVIKDIKTGRLTVTVGSLLEDLAIQKFKHNFNTSLMFMEGVTMSTKKGSLTYNEGLWRQMLRGFVHNYARRGAFNYDDLRIIKNYVFQGNPGMRSEDSTFKMECGSNLFDNIDVLIQKEGWRQITNLAPLLGADQVTQQRIVTGALDNLEVALVKIGKVRVPGIGLFEPIEDTSMNYTKLTDRQLKGVNNANGLDYTSWSGIIWDVTDQLYSNNKTLPAGTKAVNDKAKSNIYLVRPQGDSIFWGRENGRYSSKGASNILASGKTRHESFFMYGFGAMWMADPSKFAMTQVKKSARGGTN